MNDDLVKLSTEYENLCIKHVKENIYIDDSKMYGIDLHEWYMHDWNMKIKYKKLLENASDFVKHKFNFHCRYLGYGEKAMICI